MFLVGLQNAVKDTYKLQFVLLYLWFLKSVSSTKELQLGFGLAGCFLICFSVVGNVSLLVLSRTSNFKMDVSCML